MPRFINGTFLVFLFGLACILVPFYLVQAQYMFNGNISWLLIAAERLVQGQSLTQHIYETNPPLSIFIYTPHVWFAKLSGLNLVQGGLYFTTLLATLSTIGFFLIIRRFEILDRGQKASLTLAWILCLTLMNTLYYADREHIMIMGVVPFMLCQYALNNNIALPRPLTIIIFTVGALCFWLKPHYGLLPTLFMLHRMIRDRSLTTIFRPDFIILSIVSALYISSVILLFPEFFTSILPDVVSLYLGQKNPGIALNVISIYLLIYIIALFMELFTGGMSAEKKRLCLFLHICAMLCLIPYFVQLKGFYNHIIPGQAFFTLGITLSIAFRLQRYINSRKTCAMLTFVCVLLLTLRLTPLSPDFPKKSDVINLPAAQYLEHKCGSPCTYFVFHSDIEIFNPTNAQMGYTHASRFPSLWFLPAIINGMKGENAEDYVQQKDKYTGYIVEDLDYYKPSLMLIASDLHFATEKNFNFVEFFNTDPRFKDYFAKHYRKTGGFNFDRAVYFKGTTLGKKHIFNYDVYERID